MTQRSKQLLADLKEATEAIQQLVPDPSDIQLDQIDRETKKLLDLQMKIIRSTIRELLQLHPNLNRHETDDLMVLSDLTEEPDPRAGGSLKGFVPNPDIVSGRFVIALDRQIVDQQEK